MSVAFWQALGIALAALIAAGMMLRFVPSTRIPVLGPLALGYALGAGGLGWLTSERTGLFVPVALSFGAGWVAVGAAESAARMFRRAAGRSAVVWAAAFVLVAPSCIAAGLSPVVVTVTGPAGLSLPALVIVAAAAVLSDTSRFRAIISSTSIPSPKQREAARASDSFRAAALLAWPAYWAAARALTGAEGWTAPSAVASVGVSFGMGIGLGLIGMFALRVIRANLAILVLILAIVVASAVLSPILGVSTVATCFLAGLLMAQEPRTREALFNIARRFDSPFRILFLVAAGAAAPRWTGALAPLLIFAVTLAGRFLLGLAADSLASVAPGSGRGRHFAWVASIPSALSVAMVAEAFLLLGPGAQTGAGAESAGVVAGGVASGPDGGAEAFLGGWPAGSLSPVAPFLLATAVGELVAERALRKRLASAGNAW